MLWGNQAGFPGAGADGQGGEESQYRGAQRRPGPYHCGVHDEAPSSLVSMFARPSSTMLSKTFQDPAAPSVPRLSILFIAARTRARVGRKPPGLQLHHRGIRLFAHLEILLPVPGLVLVLSSSSDSSAFQPILMLPRLTWSSAAISAGARASSLMTSGPDSCGDTGEATGYRQAELFDKVVFGLGQRGGHCGHLIPGRWGQTITG